MTTENHELLFLASMMYCPNYENEQRKAVPGQAYMDDVMQMVQPGHFLDQGLKQVWKGLVALHLDGAKFTPAAVRKTCCDVGSDLAFQLLDESRPKVAGAWNWKYHAKKMIENSRQTYLKDELLQLARSDFNSDTLLDELMTLTAKIGSRQLKSQPVNMEEAIESTIKDLERRRAGEVVSAPWGVPGLDKALPRGMEAGDLTILAGRPSQGKTALMLHMAREQARLGKRVLMFSIEMDIQSLVRRMWAREAGSHMWSMFGDSRGWENEHAQKALASLRALKDRLWILPHENNFSKLMATIRQFKQAHDIDGVYLDYVGLVDSDDNQQRYLQLGKYSKELKLCAGALRLYIVMLSQLNRLGVDKDKEYVQPKLEHLRESGNLEQDADAVLMVYQDRAYRQTGTQKYEQDPLDCRPTSLYLAKGRHERMGVCYKVWFHGPSQRFLDTRPQDEKKAAEEAKSSKEKVLDSLGEDLNEPAF